MTEPVFATGLIGRLTPFPDKPHAENVIKTPDAHVVVFEFAAGQELHEHQAHHPTLIQALAGQVRIQHDGGAFDLSPGDVLYLPSLVQHEAVALTDATLQVTLLVSGSA